MEVRFKPRFLKDIRELAADAELMAALDKVIVQVKAAETPSQIGNIKKLEEYSTRYRIRLTLDRRRDYRIGLYVRKTTVWFARMLHRRNIYRRTW